MKVSAIYIAKNEADNIARSLDSIKDAVDELILVDTGSSDNTVEIFQSYGGKVYHQPWQDDFSAPRNLAISKATGDWLIVLDADEYFTPETRKYIRKVLEKVPPSCHGLNIKKYNIDGVDGEIQDFIFDLRLVRNIKNINYKGIIHESLYVSDKPLNACLRVPEKYLTLMHTGYSRELSQQKAQRNLALLWKDVENGRPIQQVYRYLYDCYHGLGDMDKAMEYAKLDVARGRQPVSYASRCYRGLLVHYGNAKNRYEQLERLKWSGVAVKDFPEIPEFHAEYGEALAQWFRYDEAVAELKQALETMDNYMGEEASLLAEADKPLLKSLIAKYAKLATKAASLRISACAIAKNEEDNIEEWLNKSEAYADEIIVVDTGSQDGTLEILEASSAKVRQIQWQDDFSYAKNIAIDEATGDWIVFNDIDEVYYSPESIRGFLAFVEINHSDIDAVMLPLSNIEFDDNGREISRSDVIRCFRNREDIRYHGAVHESIFGGNKPIDFNRILRADDRLLIRHTGYSQHVVQKKVQRDLDILLSNGGEAGVTPDKYHYLADCYFGLKQHDKALNYALLAINSVYRPVGQEVEMYSLALYLMEQQGFSAEDKLTVINAGLAECPNAPDMYGYRGLVSYQQGKYQSAYMDLHRAYDIFFANGQDGQQSHTTNFNWILVRCIYTMALCAQQLGLPQNAMAMAEEALELKPDDAGAQQAYKDICQAQGSTALEKEIKISACVIVKNEEKNISKWLDNVSVFADEIIVVDTGSEDKTVEIARDYSEKVKVKEIEWQQDFSAAKNTALSKATGDWVVFTDADELFRQPEQVRPYLQSIDSKSELAVLCNITNIDNDANGAEIDSFVTVRAFRNQENLRYHGDIHESLYYKDAPIPVNALIQADNSMDILHTGYSSSIIREKAKRNLALLLPDGGEKQAKSDSYRYIAEAYCNLDEDDQAIYFAQKALKQENSSVDCMLGLYDMVLMLMERSDYGYEDRLAVIQEGLDRYPEYPDMWYYMGHILMESQEYGEALEYFETAMDIFSKAEALLYSKFHLQEAAAVCTMAICQIKLGNTEKGMEMLLNIAKDKPYNEDVVVALADGCLLCGDNSYDKVVDLLCELYGRDGSSAELLEKMLSANGFLRLREDFLRKTMAYDLSFGVNNSQAEDAFLAGDYSTAARYAARDTEKYGLLLAVSLMNQEADISCYETRQKIKLLPEFLQQVTRRYLNKNTSDAKEMRRLINNADFQKLADYLVSYGSDECLSFWLKQVLDASAERWIYIVTAVIRNRRWSDVKSLCNGFNTDAMYQKIIGAGYQQQFRHSLQDVADGLESDKRNPELLQELYGYIEGEDLVTRIQLINSYFNRKEDGAFVAKTLMENAAPQIVAYYGVNQQLDDSTGAFYLKTGRYDLAIAELAHRLTVSCNLLLAAREWTGKIMDKNLRLKRLVGAEYLAVTALEKLEIVAGKSKAERTVARLLTEISCLEKRKARIEIPTLTKSIGRTIYENVKKEYREKHLDKNGKLKMYFLPYNASMWDALETVWLSANEDSECEAVVMPIPYYDRGADLSFIRSHWEGANLPDYVAVTDHRTCNLQEIKPDVIFIHNPYDEANNVTSIYPEYYSRKLKCYTDCLVYIPYFVSDETAATVEWAENHAAMPVYAHADIVVQQSEKMSELYIAALVNIYGEQTRYIWEDKIKGWGSPKFDAVMMKQDAFDALPEDWKKKIIRPDGSRKKLVMYGTGLSAVLRYTDKLMGKIERTLAFFKEKQDEVMMLWRPHPLIPATIVSMRPDLHERYMAIVSSYKAENWGIFDDTSELDRSIAICDAYYGDHSSIIYLFNEAKKPVMLENVDI